MRATAAGLRRAGGGRRVSTENVSKAAWPARPSLRSPSVRNVGSWCSWSATVSATATLVSTSSSAPLPLPGIAERADELVVDLGTARRDDEAPVAFVQGVLDQRFNPQAGAVGSHLNLARSQSQVIAQRLWYHQSPCLVNGCSHARMMP